MNITLVLRNPGVLWMAKTICWSFSSESMSVLARVGRGQANHAPRLGMSYGIRAGLLVGSHGERICRLGLALTAGQAIFVRHEAKHVRRRRLDHAVVLRCSVA